MFVNQDTWEWVDGGESKVESRSKCMFIPTPSPKLQDVARYLRHDKDAVANLGVSPSKAENW